MVTVRAARPLAWLGLALSVAACGAVDAVQSGAADAVQSGAAETVQSGSDACPPADGPSDDGLTDTAPLPAGGRDADVIFESMFGTTTELLQSQDSLAVLTVVSRRPPVAVGAPRNHGFGAWPSGPHATPAPDGPGADNFAVVRPARLALTRTIAGSVPDCLDLDVPGGTAGAFRFDLAEFPATFAAGDRVLAFVRRDGDLTWAGSMWKAGEDGSLTLPTTEREVVDLDTWAPELPPPLPPPDPSDGSEPAPPAEDAAAAG